MHLELEGRRFLKSIINRYAEKKKHNFLYDSYLGKYVVFKKVYTYITFKSDNFSVKDNAKFIRGYI